MSDNKQQRGAPDNRRIDLNDRDEVRHWTESLNISEDRLRELVRREGTSADKVRKALGQ